MKQDEKTVEVHVAMPGEPWLRSPRFVSENQAKQMVQEGRAVWPGDQKPLKQYENGHPTGKE